MGVFIGGREYLTLLEIIFSILIYLNYFIFIFLFNNIYSNYNSFYVETNKINCMLTGEKFQNFICRLLNKKMIWEDQINHKLFGEEC